MQLILVRHADAEPAKPADGDLGLAADAARALTPRGRVDAEALRDGLRRLDIAPDVIASSLLVRAKQTAEALAPLLPPGRQPVTLERLGPDQLRPKKLSKEVSELAGDVVILVGHMSDLGIYAAWLLGAPGHILNFEKAGACAFEVPDDDITEGSGQLQWFTTPAWYPAPVRVASPEITSPS